jgi:hypothetical protein
MRRKILMGALALALPAGSVLVLQGAAGAKSVTDPVNCTGLGASVNLAPPGISHNGSTQTTGKPTVTTVTNAAIASCTESKAGGANVGGATVAGIKPIKLKPTKVAKGNYNYGTCGAFASSNTLASAEKGLKKIVFGFAAGTVKFKTTGFMATVSGTGEVGFAITGTAKGPYGNPSATINAYLGTDTGPGTTGNFTSDLGTCTGSATPAMTIATAAVDPASSNASL